jgi:hypothetical protein
MSVFPDWQKYAVPQKRPGSGCIPTGYEIILRASGVKDVDFSTFQDDFDLDKDRQPHQEYQNNFESVAKAIKSKYPQVKLKKLDFAKGEGALKLKAIEEMISNKKPILISLALTPPGQRGWHIMPVVDSTDDELTLLYGTLQNGSFQVMNMKKTDLVAIHEQYDGGNDIAFLED